MASMEKCFVYFLLIFICFQTCLSYKWNIVEEDCSSGSYNISIAEKGSESAGILVTTRHRSYRLQMKCRMELEVPPSYGVVISIRIMDLRVSLTGQCIDFLKIFFGDGSEPKSLCQSHRDFDEAQSYATNNGSLRLVYETGMGLDNKTMSLKPGFQITFTSFRDSAHTNISTDDPEYFECDNGRIIWSGLKCDGHNNCGDRSDEGASDRIDCGVRSTMPFVIAGTLMIMFLFIACMVTLVCRKRNRSLSLRKRIGSKVPITSKEGMSADNH